MDAASVLQLGLELRLLKIEQVETDTLEFDRQNPRLAEYGITPKSTDEKIIGILWDEMDAAEIALSIAASGFFAHEQLIVAKEKGKNIVLEGNRRLAAVRVLRERNLADGKNWNLPKMKRAIVNSLNELPVIFTTRKDSWRPLGFKHVNGPAKWTSYAKAAYVADVVDKYNVTLSGIAAQIGDEHNTVRRLYRGLMVLRQAEKAKVFDRKDRTAKRFGFSHLYTGLDLQGIANFLKVKPLDAESKNPIPKEKIKQLGELCVWIYGSKSDEKEHLVRSQNPYLRRLNQVVQSREGLAAIRAGSDLDEAIEITRESKDVLEEAIFSAKRQLVRARGRLATGYDGSTTLLNTAEEISEIADSVYDEMDRIRQRKRSKKKSKKKKGR